MSIGDFMPGRSDIPEEPTEIGKWCDRIYAVGGLIILATLVYMGITA